MARSFWRDKRVLLTGHTGFTGSWLALWLEEMGARVTGLSLDPPSQPNLFSLARVAEGIDHHHCDLRDLAASRTVVAEARPEIVFHLAAQALVRASYADPVGTLATNVLGMAHLLECCRGVAGLRAVVVVTSDKCYENREWDRPYAEGDAMGGHDPYSASKGAAELVTAAYRQSFFNPERHGEHGIGLATARAGNIIGGGDWGADRLLPDMIRAFEAGETVAIRYPAAVRPWQHVLDPLAGYLGLAERLWTDGPGYSEAWNFGPPPGNERPVRELVEKSTALWGAGAAWERDGRAAPHEAGFLKLDCAKAEARLGWRGRLDLDAALSLTLDWYKDQAGGGDARAMTCQQIRDFEAGEG